MKLNQILKEVKLLLNGTNLSEEVAPDTTEVIETPVDAVELETEESVEIKMAQALLEDGVTVVESDDFAVGSPIFIVTEDENVPVPVGEYRLEDGTIIGVEQEGIIASVVQEGADTEEEPAEEAEPELESVSKIEFDEAVAQLQKALDELKEALNLSEQTVSEKDSEIEGLKLSLQGKDEEVEGLKVKLSELPATKKLAHSPEVLAIREKLINKNENQQESTFSKILSDIAKNKN
jgi:hypothetical protein